MVGTEGFEPPITKVEASGFLQLSYVPLTHCQNLTPSPRIRQALGWSSLEDFSSVPYQRKNTIIISVAGQIVENAIK